MKTKFVTKYDDRRCYQNWRKTCLKQYDNRRYFVNTGIIMTNKTLKFKIIYFVIALGQSLKEEYIDIISIITYMWCSFKVANYWQQIIKLLTNLIDNLSLFS